MPFPSHPPTTPAFVRDLAERFGDREMIVFDDRRLSYREADRLSARLARALLAEGVGKGTHVGVLMPNSPDWLIAWLAITRIGAVMVPINTFYQARELAWILRHADIEVLLTVPRLLAHDYMARLEEAIPGLREATGHPLRLTAQPMLRRIFVFGDRDSTDADRAWARDGLALMDEERGDPVDEATFLAAVEETVTPADPMVILYSSGSTADPKGAIHSHGAVLRHGFNLGSVRDRVPDDRIWSPMPFFWVGGFTFALLGNLYAGSTTLGQAVFDPAATLDFLERERVTMALGWPHFGKALAEHPSFATRDLSSMRGGNMPGLVPESVVPSDPQRRPNTLGMTETCGPHTWNERSGPLPDAWRGSFGRAVEGIEHRIIDPDTGAILPTGELGEICVRGYSLMLGLYKVEREQVFEPDGFYRTGDLGYFTADGMLYFTGRAGEMIKTAGANVTPSEVEQVLVAQPEVKDAHVVGVDDADRGQRVVAAVVLVPGARIEPEVLRARIKRELSAYKVPRQVFVYADGTVPFTDSGKVDKRRLAEQLAGRSSQE